MVSRVGDHPDRHSCPVFGPHFDRRKTAECIFVLMFYALAKGVPLDVVNGFDQPAVFPINALSASVYELAEAIEVKLRVFGLSRDGRTGELRRNLRGRKCVERTEEAGSAVEVRTWLAFRRTFESLPQQICDCCCKLLNRYVIVTVFHLC